MHKALFEAPEFKSLEPAVECLVQEATRRLLVMALEASEEHSMAIWVNLQEAEWRRPRRWSGCGRPCSSGTRSRRGARGTRANVEFGEPFVHGRQRAGGRKEWIGPKHGPAYDGKKIDAWGRAVLN